MTFQASFMLQGQLNNVLADVVINNVGDLPPAGFSLIEKTIDTSEYSLTHECLVKIFNLPYPFHFRNRQICHVFPWPPIPVPQM